VISDSLTFHIQLMERYTAKQPRSARRKPPASPGEAGAGQPGRAGPLGGKNHQLSKREKYEVTSISSTIWNILTCSYCGSELEKTDNGAECIHCGLQYRYTNYGSLDLRLKKEKKYDLEFELGSPLPSKGEFQVEPLKTNRNPEVDFSKIQVPWRISREVLSYFPKAKAPDSLMLDLGCGNAIHKSVCEYAGFQWIGLDYDSTKAPILGDAHSLPFRNESLEFVLSIAVLEHIRFPFVMMREVYRVLKPQGRFIGTVAFLEPFHGDSYYHHTHLGTFNSLQYGGFTIEKIAPSEEWSVFAAQASMGLFPRMPKFMAQAIVYPIQRIHILWWQAANLINPKFTKKIRIRNTTGAFTFIATKHAG
jgi:ubiquinone/menaquinone biosynthesis C-methylase UbiE